MRKLTIVTTAVALGSLALITYLGVARTDDNSRDQELREIIANSRSEFPEKGLGQDWSDCLTRSWSVENKAPDRIVCETWTQQGITSSLITLQLGQQRIPIVESRLAGVTGSEHVVLDIQGGPGGAPFHVSQGASDERISQFRRSGLRDWMSADIRQSPYHQLLERGYTIASIGYWGMRFRTLNAPREFEIAARDVRMAADYYRDRQGADLPLITVSLGNHLALAALGKKRIEKMNVLSLVPAMDGLQPYLRTTLSTRAAEKKRAEAAGQLFGEWAFFNIYKQSSDGLRFDSSGMLPFDEFSSRFIDKADFPWRSVEPKAPCSKVVLGDTDPRTLAYLASADNLPEFVHVLKADHNLFKDAPDRTRELFAGFANCLASGEK